MSRPVLSDKTADHLKKRPKTNDLMRFSVAMPEDLLMDFDRLVARRGLAKNRSEVIRDLVREALVEERSAVPGTIVMGTLTIVYDHHSSDLNDKLHTIQHDYFDNVVSTMHVHASPHLSGGHRAAGRNGAHPNGGEHDLGHQGRTQRQAGVGFRRSIPALAACPE